MLPAEEHSDRRPAPRGAAGRPGADVPGRELRLRRAETPRRCTSRPARLPTPGTDQLGEQLPTGGPATVTRPAAAASGAPWVLGVKWSRFSGHRFRLPVG